MRQIKTVFAGLSALIILAGCSSSEPSTSTIKKQISDKVVDCPLKSISDFERLNGRLQNDGSYLVNIKFNLNIEPSDNNESSYKQYTDLQKKLFDEDNDDRHKNNALMTILNRCDAEGANSGSDSACTDQNMNSVRSEGDALRSRANDLDSQLSELYSKYSEMMDQDYITTGCSNVFIASEAANSRENVVEKYGEKRTINYRYTLVFVKSDDGWVMNQ